MLHPSYSDLLEVLNNDPNNDDTISSRYTIVIAAAKRARQLVDHAQPLTNKVKIDKPVSIAVHELNEGKIQIKQHTPIIEATGAPDHEESEIFAEEIAEVIQERNHQ